ncbi:hypothetical protein SDC9_170919 [bioreactor metagenome]|uniref:Uncharacterized protein n=1 Tax=bioreactor metagenome TaxID=1076179 RepID=A0A645GBU7_9ZZZZ
MRRFRIDGVIGQLDSDDSAFADAFAAIEITAENAFTEAETNVNWCNHFNIG